MQKPCGSFWKVSGSFHEFPMNFVHAEAQCFCMYEIHMKVFEASGKCQPESFSKFLEAFRILPSGFWERGELLVGLVQR